VSHVKTASGPTLLPGISSLVAATNELIKAAAQNDSPVFVTGEVGTEKAFAAKLIHQLSRRSTRPLTKINVTWKLPPDLKQYFDQTRGGTVLFNLQKDFPIDMQYMLVEMASHGSFADPISGELIESDVRLILTTSFDLEEFAAGSEILPELAELLQSQHIIIPPLRTRPEDIPALVRYATTRARDTGRSIATGADPQVLTLFRQWNWPGNAEDLLLVTAQAAIATKTDLIALSDLPETFIRQIPPEMLVAARQVRTPRPGKALAKRRSDDEVRLPTFTPLPLKSTEAESTEFLPQSHHAAETPVPVSRADEQPLATTPESSAQEAPVAQQSGLSPRVLQLARRLNAQSAILSRQMVGPLDAHAVGDLEASLGQSPTEKEALAALESELDRGLEMVLAMRRQMALLNLRQQQNAETLRELVNRIAGNSEGTDTPLPVDQEAMREARELATNLQAIESILNRVQQDVPQLGSHIEGALSGEVPLPRITTSGLFRKKDLFREDSSKVTAGEETKPIPRSAQPTPDSDVTEFDLKRPGADAEKTEPDLKFSALDDPDRTEADLRFPRTDPDKTELG
jgi:hypothetical protein